jgi:hypothetical protein
MFEERSKEEIKPIPPALKEPAAASKIPEDLIGEVLKTGPAKGKIIIFAIIGIIILGGISFGGYFLYQRFSGNKNLGENLNISQSAVNYTISDQEPSEDVLTICYLKNNPSSSAYFPAGKIRQEYESLAVAQDCSSFSANQINSVLNNLTVDRDQDGLNYFLERKYGTDDEKKDTDGDSHDDLTEINNGYNPNGPGKLDF